MNAKILLVEDNPINMRLLRMMLRNSGHLVLEAADGQAALDVALRERPDLIIMDIQLPKISGVEVTRRLRQDPALRHKPIVALTAFAMKEERERILGAGFDAYLTKPIDTRQFPPFIDRILQLGNNHDKQEKSPGG